MAIALRSLGRALLLTLAATVAVTGAHAQDRVKEALFEECGVAKREFTSLDAAARDGLLPYLSRVVGLNLQAPNAAEVFAALPGLPQGGEHTIGGPAKGPEVPAQAIWKTLDATRERRAKRCALELLVAAGPSALRVVGTLIETYQDESLSDELQVALEESIAGIAEQAHLHAAAPSDAELDALIQHLSRARPLAAYNVLTEYLAIAMPRVIIALSKAPTEDAQRPITDFLRSADPDGERAMRAFIEVAPSLPTATATTLAQQLIFPSKATLPAFLSDFARLAVGLDSSAIFLPLLLKSCRELGTLPAEVATLIAPASALVTDPTQSPESLRCLVAATPQFAPLVENLTLSSQPDQAARGLALLPAAFASLEPQARSALFSHLRGIATRPGELSVAALQRLALFPERRSEVLSTVYQVLKATDTTGTHQAAFDLLATFTPGKDTARFRSAFIAALMQEPPIPAVVAIAPTFLTPHSDLFALISPEHLARSQVALKVLKAEKKADLTRAAKLVALLKFPSLREAVYETLRSYGPPLVPVVRKALPILSGEARLSALALVLHLGQPTRQELSEASASFAEAHCEVIQSLQSAVFTLHQRTDLPTTARAGITKRLASCVPVLPPAAIPAALEITLPQEPAAAAGQLIAWIEEQHAAPATRSALRDLITSPQIPQPERLHPARNQLLLWALQHGEARERLAAIEGCVGTDSPELRAALRLLADDTTEVPQIIGAARKVLAQLGDTQYDWPAVIQTMIKEAGAGALDKAQIAIISALPADVVLPEVGAALESSTTSTVAGGCQIAAVLGERAVPIVSKLWQLRDKRAPAIRYAAVLALLQINPMTPELQDHVRLLLVNRYFAHALTRPIQWHKAVAVVDLDKGSFGTLRTVHLERLLA